MQLIVSGSLIIAGLIHLPPLVGVVGRRQLESAYGVKIGEPNLEVVMRHRAVLLGSFGAFWIVAGFVPSLQTAAFVTALISVASFLWLTWSMGATKGPLAKVFVADLVALASLLVGLVAHILGSSV